MSNYAFQRIHGKTIVRTTFDAEDENDHEMQPTGWQAILNNFKTIISKAAESRDVATIGKANGNEYAKYSLYVSALPR